MRIPTQSRFVLLIALVLVSTTVALAGPPLVCWKVETGGARSLPWVDRSSSYEGMDASYPTAHLPTDTLALLGVDAPVLARMETLRRAALYSTSDPRAGEDLLARLVARTKDEPRNGLAWFDAGYFVAALRQARSAHEPELWTKLKQAVGGSSPKIDGYALVAKGIELEAPNPEMEYAAALVTWYPRRAEHERHLGSAVAAATPGSPLEKNLLEHFRDRGRTLAEIQASLGSSARSSTRLE